MVFNVAPLDLAAAQLNSVSGVQFTLQLASCGNKATAGELLNVMNLFHLVIRKVNYGTHQPASSVKAPQILNILGIMGAMIDPLLYR